MAKKKTTTKKDTETIEQAIERGIEKGITNTAKKALKNSTCKHKEVSCNGASGWIYFLGIIGAAIHYISTTTGFWNIVLALLKAIVWPAMIVLKILGL